MRRIAIIVNPISGAAGREADLARFGEALRAAGCESFVRPTRGAGDAAVLACEEAERGVDAIVAAGGDGTLNEVASGLRALGDAAPPLGILPLGTSNLVARELGIPFRPDRAARVVAEGEPFAMDAVEVTTPRGPRRQMLSCAGVGWDAHVVRELTAARKGHITFLTWFRPIGSALRDYRFPPFRVITEDGRSEEGVLALFLNCRPYAAFFRPQPDARPDDGLLDVLLVRRAGLVTMLRLGWRGWRGTMAHDGSVVALRGTSFRVEADVPVPFQIDGDVGGDTPLAMLVRPRAVRLLRPRAGTRP